MVAEAIGSLFVQAGFDTAHFDAGVEKVRAGVKSLGKLNFGQGIKDGLSEVDSWMRSTAGQAGVLGSALTGLGFAGAAAGAAIVAGFAGARQAMAFGDDIADTANKLRVSTDYLQEMRFAAHQLGGEFQSADEALDSFGKTLGLARSGLSAKAAKPFKALGLDPDDFATVEAGLQAVIAKIAGVRNAAEQAAIADKLGLTPLLPAIREGTAAIDDMRRAAQSIGYVMDAELIEKAGAANDQYEALTQVLDVQFKSAMVDAIPIVMRLTEMMVAGAKASGWFAERLDDAAKIGAAIGRLDPFAQADIQEAQKYDAERKRRMAAAKADYMRPGAVSAASNLSSWLGTGKADPTVQLRNLIAEQERESAATRASAKAQRDAAQAARERLATLEALADQMRSVEDRSADFAASLMDEVATMGMSSDAIKRRQILLEAAAAPTAALAALIRALGEEYAAQNRVMGESTEIQRTVRDQQGESITTIHDAIGAGIEWSTTLSDLSDRLGMSADLSSDLAYGVESIAQAINRNDWTSAFASLAGVLRKVETAFKSGASSADKFAAAAGLAQGVGNLIGGSTGSAISATASGALTGFQFGGPIGAVIGGGLGLITSIFGSSKAKKQAKAQAAAEAAAREAQRQQQIADANLQLRIDLLNAQGKAEEALALEHQAVLDKLAKLDPALVAMQEEVWASAKAAEAAAAEAEAAAAEAEAQAAALEKSLAAQRVQRSILLQLMALDDAVTGGNSAVLAAREDELAALDPVSQELKKLYWARQDESEALAKQAQATELATQATEAAAQAARSYQEANVAIMRDLMAMDDAVLGTTSARDAARADELAKLDETGKKLKLIYWARQDEAEAIAKQTAATEAATAAAEEAARKAAELLQQRIALENDLLGALGQGSTAMAREREAALAGLEPALRPLQEAYWQLADANESLVAAEQDAIEAREKLADVYQREKSTLSGLVEKWRSVAEGFKSFSEKLQFGATAANSPSEQYSKAKADFDRVARLVGEKDEKALGELQGVSERFLEASQDAQTENIGYFRDLAAVKAATRAAEGYALEQVDVAERQLLALDASVAGLLTVNGSVLSVRDAIGSLSDSMSRLAMAASARDAASRAAQDALQKSADTAKAKATVAVGANDNVDLAAAKVLYLSATGGVDTALFNQYFGTSPLARMNEIGWEGDPEALRAKWKFAEGGAFTNGVVHRPTMFDAALMGEAGPEGILPLANGPHGLGVYAYGGGKKDQLGQTPDGYKLDRIAQAAERTANLLTRVTRDGDALIVSSDS